MLKIINGLIQLIYPASCLICRKPLKDTSCVDQIVCLACWAKIKKNPPPFCHRCGRHLDKHNLTKNTCPHCVRNPLHFDRAFSPCVYEGVIKELIHNFKYRRKDYLGKPLSKLLIEFIREYNLPMSHIDTIIPVPLHKSRLREREFNQAEVLSGYISREFNKGVLKDNLIRHRFTRTQTELPPEERRLNVKESFSLKNKEQIRGRNILLVDDVLTTAATSSEAAYTLKKADAGIVFVLTLAN